MDHAPPRRRGCDHRRPAAGERRTCSAASGRGKLDAHMTQIIQMLDEGTTFSFEFFPPKNDVEQATLVRTLRELEPLNPAFVSVTYRGGRVSRQRTHDLVPGMIQTTSLNPMAHLTCVVHSRLELAAILVELPKAGVKRMAELSGCEVPSEIVARVEAVADDPEDVRRVGVELATELCRDLLDNGVPGLHFYTLNRSTATRE